MTVIKATPRVIHALKKAAEAPPQTYTVLPASEPLPVGGVGKKQTYGYFALQITYDTETNAYTGKIIDDRGSLPSHLAGLYVSGCDRIPVPTITFAITGAGYVWLKCDYDRATNAWTASYQYTSELPSLSDTYFAGLIGYVKALSGGGYLAIQIHSGGVMYNNRYA